MPPGARYFESPAAFREWLEANYSRAAEVLVGFHKSRTGRAGLTWPQSVAEALCFGWIDGVRRRVDDERYSIRFTPRKKGSIWSAVNIRMVAELEASGRMIDAGRAAFAARQERRSRVYSYEQKVRETRRFDAATATAFRKNKKAWAFFEAQPPWYQKKATWWVMGAKQEATRARRLAKLVQHSAAGERLD
jgi:uncharacterized protein YdeI (YjbR/CyaY-like superfamily)